MRASWITVLGVGGIVLSSVGPAASPAHAAADFGGFRCSGRLVLDGDTDDDVSKKCGDPDAVRTWTEYRTESIWKSGHKIERSIQIQYAEWKYDFGSERLVCYATFVQGLLASTRTGSYGR